MQLLKLWQMANLVLKQSVKAHGPLVDYVKQIYHLTFTVNSLLFALLRQNHVWTFE